MEGRRIGDEGTPLALQDMRPWGRIAGLVAAAGLTAALIPGCGGGSSPAGDSSATAAEAERSATFLVPGGNNTIPRFGREADAGEREAASTILEESLKAREAGDWAKQCTTLGPHELRTIEETSLLADKTDCAGNLEENGLPIAETEGLRADTMTGPIDALRVKGDRGYALYHGAKGKDYAIRMEKVGGRWKVGAILTRNPGS
jgi:hypothetical protein